MYYLFCSLHATLPSSPGLAATGLGAGMQVLTNIKDMDPRMLAWKGASILARLDQADDYWVEGDEWRERGVALLRDVLPFVW
jgi:actin-related protein